eukprot:m51a1_g12393 putative protein kinase domain containing protein (1288) ;mRNA; r:667777-672627
MRGPVACLLCVALAWLAVTLAFVLGAAPSAAAAEPADPPVALIAVISSSRAVDADWRDAARRTWLPRLAVAQSERPRVAIAYRFFVGQRAGACGNETRCSEGLAAVQRESAAYGDVVVLAGVPDTYEGLSEKTAAVLEWAATQYGSRLAFVAKVDNDVWVRPGALVDYAMSRRRLGTSYIGYVWRDVAIRTDAADKWRETRWQLPRYPPYCNGPSYIVGGDLVRALHRAGIRNLKRFSNEDASVSIWLSTLSAQTVHQRLMYPKPDCGRSRMTCHAVSQGPQWMVDVQNRSGTVIIAPARAMVWQTAPAWLLLLASLLPARGAPAILPPPAPVDLDLLGPAPLPVLRWGVAQRPFALPAAGGDPRGPHAVPSSTPALALSWRPAGPNATAGLRYWLSQAFSPWRAEGDDTSEAAGSAVAVTLGAHGSAPAGEEGFGARVTCSATFVGLVTWTFAWQGEGVDYAPAAVSFLWKCVRPNCSADCSAHGVCDHATGECRCDRGYVGRDCNVLLDSPARVCPSLAPLAIPYALPPQSTELAWLAVMSPSQATLDWRYFATGTTRLPTPGSARPPLSGNVTVSVVSAPGQYVLLVYGSDGFASKLAAVPLEVLPWAACGHNESCASNETCGAAEGAGVCGAGGSCVCASSRLWHDCSHGCGPGTARVTERSGVIRSDNASAGPADSLVPRRTHCTWVVSPEGSWGRLTVAARWVDLGDSGVLRLTDLATGAEYVVGRDDGARPPPMTFGASGCRVDLQTGNSNSRGFELAYSTSLSPQLSPLAVALIASGATAGVALAAALLAAALWRIRRRSRRGRKCAAAAVWPADEEQSAESAASTERLSVAVSKARLDFGVEAQSTCPIMQSVRDTLVLTNTGWFPARYEVLVPDGGPAFELVVRPGSGTIPVGHSAELRAKFKLQFTTSVNRAAKIIFYSPFGVAGHAIVRIALQGAVSDRLDPGEISLDPKPLGSGAYGTVYRGLYRNRRIAVKVLRNQHMLTEEQISDFNREIDLYRRLRSPFIVEFVGASHVPGKVCMCTELMECGSLEKLLSREAVPLHLQYRFAMNIAEGVFFLHSNNILYRDLKPSNVLIVSTDLSAKVNCKISDFGTSKNVPDASELFKYTCGQGTPLYMAPELFSRGPYNLKVDVFAFAVTLWQMAARRDPWENVAMWDVPKAVVSGRRPEIPDDCPAEYAALIARCWATDPQDRPAFDGVLNALAPLTGVPRLVSEVRRVFERASFPQFKRFSRAFDEEPPEVSLDSAVVRPEPREEKGPLHKPLLTADAHTPNYGRL